MRHPRTVTAICSCLLLIAGCTGDLTLSGVGGQTTNGITVAVVYPGGIKAAVVPVRVRPETYVANIEGIPGGSNRSVRDGATDNNGIFKVDSLSPGSYLIECYDGKGFAVAIAHRTRDSGGLVNAGTEVLKSTGVVHGILPPQEQKGKQWYVQVYGMERLAAVDRQTGDFAFPDLPAGRYNFRQVSHDSSDTPLEMSDIQVRSNDTTVVSAFAAWRFSAVLRLNTTASGADVAETVYNFPVLIRLMSPAFDFSQARADGGDVRFAKKDGTVLSYEIEQWDPASGSAVFWVTMDTVRGNNGTQSLSIFWGNPGASGRSDGTAVFDTARGFAGVWHLGRTSGTLAIDATVNGIHGTLMSTVTVGGVIGEAQSFDGVSSMIQASGPASDKVNFQDTGMYSVSAWVNATALDTFPRAIVFKSNAQYGLQVLPEHEWEFITYIDKTRWEGTRSPAASGSWHLITGVRNRTKQYLYVDGVCVDSTVSNIPAIAPENVARAYDKPLEIGHCPDGGRNPDRFFGGIIDEVRILRTSLHPDWIKLCYMNQKESDALVVW